MTTSTPLYCSSLTYTYCQIEDIYQTAYRHRFYRGGPVLMSALSGLGEWSKEQILACIAR